jgi:hypothetical protein
MLLMGWCSVVHAQRQKECGNALKPSQKPFYNSIIERARQMPQPRANAASYYYVRLFIHNFLSDDGTDSAWSYNEIITEFNQASGFFSQYNMCLVLTGIDYPRNTEYKDSFNTVHLNDLVAIGHTYAIDVYLHKKLQDGTSPLNGTAYDIPSKYTSLSRGAIGNRSFAHEVGHCLGLLHTFETVYGLECPDGSNSDDAGDRLSDTRATPDSDNMIANNTDAACVYSGTITINCNGSLQAYNPEIINMMCYGRRACRSIFTSMQLTVMQLVLENIPGLQEVWFEDAFAIHIGTPIGTLLINVDDYYAAGLIQIGDNRASGYSVLMGGNASQQKIIATGVITITPGVKLLQPSSDRGRIQIKAGALCQE